MPIRLQKLLILTADFAALLVSFLLGVVVLCVYGGYPDLHVLQVWWQSTGQIHTLGQAFFVGLVLVRFYVKGLYSKRLPFWDELRLILMTLSYLAVLNGIFVLIARWPFSKSLWLSSWLFSLVLVPVARGLIRRALSARGHWKRQTIIIGTGDTAWSTYLALQSEPMIGFELKNFLALNSDVDNRIQKANLNVQTADQSEFISEIAKAYEKEKNLQVIIALEQTESNLASGLLERLSLFLDDVYLVPALGGLPLFGLEAQHFFSHEVLLLKSKNNLKFRPQVMLKRLFDLASAGLGLILISPLLLWIAFKIRKSGPGVLFTQPRIGYHGQIFYCYKFRTMIPNAEQVLVDLINRDPIAKKEWEEKTKISNDPRVTPIGNFLRKTSLDELPQLINVIRGEMSLVGPRPILIHEVEKYGPRLAFYKTAKPGLTGLWQVSGRSDTEYSNRVHLDTWYVKNWSLWTDIAILFKTVRVVFKREGAY